MRIIIMWILIIVVQVYAKCILYYIIYTDIINVTKSTTFQLWTLSNGWLVKTVL